MADDNAEPFRRGVVKTDPDPSAATVSLIKSSIDSVKDLITAKDEVVKARLDASDKAVALIGTYPTAIDVAIENLRKLHDEKFAVAAESRNLIVEMIHNKIAKIEEVSSEKYVHLNEHTNSNFEFNGEKLKSLTQVIEVFKQTVNDRFQLGDIQTEKAARDVKSAVDAAFAAAKEAVGEQNKSNALSITKSETAFTKQIDQLADSVKSIVKNTDDKIGDIKERLLAIEGKTSVSDPRTAQMLQDMNAAITRLSSGADLGTGRSQQSDAVLKTTLTVGGMLIALVAVLLTVFEIMKSSGAAGN